MFHQSTEYGIELKVDRNSAKVTGLQGVCYLGVWHLTCVAPAPSYLTLPFKQRDCRHRYGSFYHSVQ